MQVTVSRVSPIEISLRVALPKAQVSTALDLAYIELGKKAQLRGFRPGKVPRALLKQYFGAKVQDDVLRALVNATLPNALRDNRIDPISEPRVEPDSELSPSADWSYTVWLEVRPELGEIDLSTLTLTRNVYEVHEHEVEEGVAVKREQAATLRTPDPARSPRNGDSVTFDFEVTLDGELRPEFGAQGRTVELGRAALLAEIEAALFEMNAGESKGVEITFPEKHRNPEIAGKKAAVRVTLSEVQEKILPELDDEFAKDVGFESLGALREKYRAELTAGLRARSEDELRSEAIEMLVIQNPLTPPPSMVEKVYQGMTEEAVANAGASGQRIDHDEIREEARKRVRAGLLLTEIARRYALQVTEAELEAKLQEIAVETQRAIQRLRVEYRDAKKREILVATILEDKVLGLMLSKATVTEKAAQSHVHAPEIAPETAPETPTKAE